MKSAYLFTSEEFGVEPLLKLLGIGACERVSPSNIKSAVNKILKETPDESLLIFSDTDENMRLLEKLRFEKSVSSPLILLSFSDKAVVEKKLTLSPKAKQPMLSFDKGMYYLKMPFRIDSLRDILKEAVPIEKAEMDTMKAEYEFATRYKEDADFRHRCANLSSAIRILQGTYYAGDIKNDEYLLTLESLRQLSWKTPSLRTYAKTIKDYIDKYDVSVNALPLEESKIADIQKTRIVLLDDEAFTSGWDTVLKALFQKHGYSFSSEIDRDKFLNDIEYKEQCDFDVLLLDLKMPDMPGKSIYLLERIKDKFPEAVVIIFTAIDNIRVFDRCKKAGAFDYFVKEFGPEDRDPLSYYKKLKWIIERAKELTDEKAKVKVLPKRIGEPAIYTRKVHTYIPISPTDETMIVQEEWHSFFAFVVKAIGQATEKTSQEIEEKRERILSWLLKEPSDGRQLSLRYITKPDQGDLTIAIIGKTTGKTCDLSLKRAITMCNNLSLLLKEFSIYNLDVVKDEKDLFLILEPFQPADIVSLQREEIPVEIDGKNFTAVYPFSFNPRTYLDGLINTMLNYDVHMMVNIALWPISLAKELEQFKREIDATKLNFNILHPKSEALAYIEGPGQRVSTRLSMPRKDEITAEKVETALGSMEEQWKSLRMKGRYLFGSFDIASESEIPSIITETLSYDFFGADAHMQVIRHDKEELKNIWRDIRYLNFRKPRINGRLMVNLFDLSQAKTIFQLPLPKEEGVRGITMESLNIIRVPAKSYKLITDDSGFLIANGFVRNEVVPVHLKPMDLIKHLYVCGKTGSGKSTLLLRLALSLAQKGEGLCLIDPHGDVSLTFKDLLPKRRFKDMIFFDPIDEKCKVKFNLLENDGTAEQQETIYQEFINMMLKLYDPKQYMGPMFERVFRFTLLLAMASNCTLVDLIRIWNDNNFKEKCLKNIDSSSPRGKEIVDFWKNELPELLRNKDWAGFQTYVVSKLDRFSSNHVMARILSAKSSSLNFDDVINGKKIFIARLPKGSLGEINAYTLGMIISFKLKAAIMRRGKIPEIKRHTFYLIIDEFHNFLAPASMTYSYEDSAFAMLLSEARKFRVSMILANQYIHQLGTAMRNSVFGNIQSRFFFGVNAEDASHIKEQIPIGPAPEFYVTSPNFYALAQLLVNGEQVGPFTIRTIVPE